MYDRGGKAFEDSDQKLEMLSLGAWTRSIWKDELHDVTAC
jgi:hypothetical protein